MKGGECSKRVDEVCASDAYKQTPHCVEWTKQDNPGWYQEMEGPCEVDSQCWPSLACCGQHPNGKYCAPRDMCERLSASSGLLGGAPTWAYVVGGSVLAVALVAAFT
jgi:hypothetical protein